METLKIRKSENWKIRNLETWNVRNLNNYYWKVGNPENSENSNSPTFACEGSAENQKIRNF